MSSQRILLLGQPGLLTQGVRYLLEEQGDAQVTFVDTTTPDAVDQIGALSPDAAIIAENGAASTELIASLLHAHPNVPILRVSLERNRVYIHTSEQVVATTANLLGIMRNLRAHRRYA